MASACLYLVFAKPNLIVNTDLLIILCNYFSLICKAEILYPPQLYLKRFILYVRSLAIPNNLQIIYRAKMLKTVTFDRLWLQKWLLHQKSIYTISKMTCPMVCWQLPVGTYVFVSIFWGMLCRIIAIYRNFHNLKMQSQTNFKVTITTAKNP